MKTVVQTNTPIWIERVNVTYRRERGASNRKINK